MSRLTLDISALQVETFTAGPAFATAAAPATYPDCPTATGCTCYAACQSIVMPVCAPATVDVDAQA